MRSKVTIQPAVEPVTLAEVKSSLKITSTAADALLSQMIVDARIYAERFTGKKFISQTITSYYDSLSGHADIEWFSGNRKGAVTQLGGTSAILEFGPAQSITTVHTIDDDNSETLYAASNYYLDHFDDDLRPQLRLNSGSSMTWTRDENGVKIVYIAGYGDAATDVPSPIRRSINLLVGHMYANRGDCGDKCSSDCGAMPLLDSYRFENTSGLR